MSKGPFWFNMECMFSKKYHFVPLYVSHNWSMFSYFQQMSDFISELISLIFTTCKDEACTYVKYQLTNFSLEVTKINVEVAQFIAASLCAATVFLFHSPVIAILVLSCCQKIKLNNGGLVSGIFFRFLLLVLRLCLGVKERQSKNVIISLFECELLRFLSSCYLLVILTVIMV